MKKCDNNNTNQGKEVLETKRKKIKEKEKKLAMKNM